MQKLSVHNAEERFSTIQANIEGSSKAKVDASTFTHRNLCAVTASRLRQM